MWLDVTVVRMNSTCWKCIQPVEMYCIYVLRLANSLRYTIIASGTQNYKNRWSHPDRLVPTLKIFLESILLI